MTEAILSAAGFTGATAPTAAEMSIVLAACVVVSYLIGSVPTGYLWGRARGIDIRTVGSGNIGATNVMRALGKGPGLAVLGIDAAKGFLPVFFAPRLFPDFDHHLLQIVGCISVIAGHNWTCWLKFKGGKGIATSAGALLAFLPGPVLCGLAVWGMVFGISRYVSLASICAAVALPIATGVITGTPSLIVFTVIVGGLAIWKHRANIQRLRAGTEPRVGGSPKTPVPEPRNPA